jgi:hypothetical protein
MPLIFNWFETMIKSNDIGLSSSFWIKNKGLLGIRTSNIAYDALARFHR